MRISAKDISYIQPKARHGHLDSELMHNLSVKARPDGGALKSIIERYISDVDYKLRSEGKDNKQILSQIHNDLKEDLQNYVNGYDFELVLLNTSKDLNLATTN